MKLKKWVVVVLGLISATIMSQCGTNEDGSIGSTDRNNPRYSPLCEAQEREWVECSGTIEAMTRASGKGSYIEFRPDGYEERTIPLFLPQNYEYDHVGDNIGANVTLIAYSSDGYNLTEVEITDTTNVTKSFWCISPGVWYPSKDYKDMHGFKSILYPSISTKDWPLLGHEGKNIPRGIEFEDANVVNVIEIEYCPAKPYKGAHLIWIQGR